MSFVKRSFLSQRGSLSEVPLCMYVFTVYVVIHVSTQYSQVEEVFEKLGDHKSLVSLYVDCFQWENVS